MITSVLKVGTSYNENVEPLGLRGLSTFHIVVAKLVPR